jgi:hypothetical protein
MALVAIAPEGTVQPGGFDPAVEAIVLDDDAAPLGRCHQVPQPQYLQLVRLVTPDREKAWSHLLTVSSLRQGCEVKPARFLN